jgi:hypothetical protein
MRTTLTLDDDVAAQIERLRNQRRLVLNELVNQALRLGLDGLERQSEPAERYRTPGVNVGRCLLPDLDDVAAVLAVAEGKDYRGRRGGAGLRR